MSDYGVLFDATPPPKFERPQVVLRILIIAIMSALAGAFGWILGLIYLGVPVLAAVLISQKGSEHYLAESNGDMTRWLRYIVGFYAYVCLLVDRLPTGEAATTVQFEVKTSGTPSVGNALLRIILAIPSAIVIGLLWIVGLILLVIAAISILISESYPSGIYDFLRGLVRWEARLLAYLASLVQDYPPFALDTGPLGAASGAAEA